MTEQVGDGVTAGVTLQAKFTIPLKPFTGVRLKVELTDPPGWMLPGAKAVAEAWKSAVA